VAEKQITTYWLTTGKRRCFGVMFYYYYYFVIAFLTMSKVFAGVLRKNKIQCRFFRRFVIARFWAFLSMAGEPKNTIQMFCKKSHGSRKIGRTCWYLRHFLFFFFSAPLVFIFVL
jgi:hypothetical protein